MLRILICCGGGFSSSALSVKVKKEIEAKGLQDEVAVDFCPFEFSRDHLDEADVIMVCPHQKYRIKQYVADYIQDKKPVYLLPPKMYGTMEVEELYTDAKDILTAFWQTHLNPFYFPGEEDILRVKRSKAYRHYYAKSSSSEADQ